MIWLGLAGVLGAVIVVGGCVAWVLQASPSAREALERECQNVNRRRID